MLIINSKKFVTELISSWNSHEIERIMKHYSDDCELSSPYVRTIIGIESGTLIGKINIRKFWELCLKKVPDLRLELIEIAEGIDTLSIYYESVNSKKAIETMYFNKNKEINKVLLHYTN
jgi:hypothetical protein